jgi:hypothetical protein
MVRLVRTFVMLCMAVVLMFMLLYLLRGTSSDSFLPAPPFFMLV